MIRESTRSARRVLILRVISRMFALAKDITLQLTFRCWQDRDRLTFGSRHQVWSATPELVTTTNHPHKRSDSTVRRDALRAFVSHPAAGLASFHNTHVECRPTVLHVDARDILPRDQIGGTNRSA